MKQLLTALIILFALSSLAYAGNYRGQDRHYDYQDSNRYEHGFKGHHGHKRQHHIKKHQGYYQKHRPYYGNNHRPYYGKKHHHKKHRHHNNWVIVNSALLGFLLGASH